MASKNKQDSYILNKGRQVTCSVCSGGGDTLVKDGKEGYKHMNSGFCARVRARIRRAENEKASG